MNALERISRAKIKLMLIPGQAFLSNLVLSLNTKIDNSQPTACTNGLEVRYNEEFIKSLSDEELTFVVAHETLHVAYLHMLRKGNRDMMRWNAACDYAINYILKKDNFKLIEGCLIDDKYANMGAEEIYEKLPSSEDNSNNAMGNDFEDPSNSGGDSSGDSDSNGGGNKPSASEVQTKIEDAVVKAAMAAEMAGQPGSIPGSISKMIDELLNPKLPWQVILQQYMEHKVKNDRSWQRRKKQFRHTYIPGRLGEAMGNVNIYVDASGSVSQGEFTAYISEMHQIRESLKPECMKVISFDTSLKDEFVMEQGEEIDVHFSGGGGTHLECVVEHAEKEETDVTIIFTDGYFSSQDWKRIPNDIIWVIVNNPSWDCPVGKVIHYKYEG